MSFDEKCRTNYYDLDVHELNPESNPLQEEHPTTMKFKVSYEVVIDDETALELADEEEVEDEFAEDKVGATEENIGNTIEGSSDDFLFDIIGSVKVDYVR